MPLSNHLPILAITRTPIRARARDLRRPARPDVALVGLLLAVVAGCQDWRPRVDPETLSVLWISLDTLRADHVGSYGYARDTTPFLDELADNGLLFEWAISPQGSTLPSHITMFTGIHPLVHGVMHSSPKLGIKLDDSVRTLPEVMHEYGFSTRAWVDGGKMKRDYGFDRGFDTYNDVNGPLKYKLERALEELDRLAPERRFFYLIHSYEIHSPYAPPEPYESRFVTPDADAARADMDRYDGSIRFVDDQLREFVAQLEARGILETTVLVITSDHGENFNEYGIADVGHGGLNLHQNITRVPFIVLHPDSRYRGRVSAPVGLIDFPSTMLAVVGIDASVLGLGTNVLEPEDREGRAYLSWTGRVKGRRGQVRQAWSLFSDTFHLLKSETQPGPERNALYDRVDDPGEGAALKGSHREAELSEQLNAHRRRLLNQRKALPKPLAVRKELPSSLLLELVALGYATGEPRSIEEVHAQIQAENAKARLRAAIAGATGEGQGEQAESGRGESVDSGSLLNAAPRSPRSSGEGR